jgi:hypothetical protein
MCDYLWAGAYEDFCAGLASPSAFLEFPAMQHLAGAGDQLNVGQPMCSGTLGWVQAGVKTTS